MVPAERKVRHFKIIHLKNVVDEPLVCLSKFLEAIREMHKQAVPTHFKRRVESWCFKKVMRTFTILLQDALFVIIVSLGVKRVGELDQIASFTRLLNENLLCLPSAPNANNTLLELQAMTLIVLICLFQFFGVFVASKGRTELKL